MKVGDVPEWVKMFTVCGLSLRLSILEPSGFWFADFVVAVSAGFWLFSAAAVWLLGSAETNHDAP